MIQLTSEQVQALNAPQQPPVAVDSRTGQEYLLIRREVYELVRGFLKPYDRGWDDSADDDLTFGRIYEPGRRRRSGLALQRLDRQQ